MQLVTVLRNLITSGIDCNKLYRSQIRRCHFCKPVLLLSSRLQKYSQDVVFHKYSQIYLLMSQTVFFYLENAGKQYKFLTIALPERKIVQQISIANKIV